MTVEILVLSGLLQGERVEFDGKRIAIAARSDIDVSFPSATDHPGAKGKQAECARRGRLDAAISIAI